MTVLPSLLAALFGLLFGSFLNVCIYRLPRDLSVVAPRSFCPACGTQLSWWENIPVFSYLALGRRCRACKRSIPLHYPLVELATAALFFSAYSRWGVSGEAFKWIVFGACLIVLFCTDLEQRLLLDEFTVGGALVGLGFALLAPVPATLASMLLPAAGLHWQSLLNSALGALLLALPVWLAGALWGRLRHREALGLGDVKLLAMLGIFLGPGKGLLALTLAAVTGAVVGLAMLVFAKKDPRNYEMPFGCFLCAAGLFFAFVPAAERLALAVL